MSSSARVRRLVTVRARRLSVMEPLEERTLFAAAPVTNPADVTATAPGLTQKGIVLSSVKVAGGGIASGSRLGSTTSTFRFAVNYNTLVDRTSVTGDEITVMSDAGTR